MGKTGDLFKMIRDIKGTFQAKTGSIKDKNGMDLTEAEDIKKSGQVLGPDALGRPRRIRWRGRWEGGSGRRIHVTPWLIHVNV